MNPKVEVFFSKAKKWPEEMKKMRAIILDCGLNEELKWGKPCYTFQENNVVIIQGFKEYCALMFYRSQMPDIINWVGCINQLYFELPNPRDAHL